MPHILCPCLASLQGGLELAQKRLSDVTTDLDNFDKRMDDLLHIATNFNYPEEFKGRKPSDADLPNKTGRTLGTQQGGAGWG